MKKAFRNSIAVAMVAAPMQFAWEYWQCGALYNANAGIQHSYLMLSTTFGDVNMSLFLYFLLSFVNMDLDWMIKNWEPKEYVIMALYALFLSFYFESHALHTGRWTYSEAMPLFLNTNIGLIPVIQLLILFPITFFISRTILKKYKSAGA